MATAKVAVLLVGDFEFVDLEGGQFEFDVGFFEADAGVFEGEKEGSALREERVVVLEKGVGVRTHGDDEFDAFVEGAFGQEYEEGVELFEEAFGFGVVVDAVEEEQQGLAGGDLGESGFEDLELFVLCGGEGDPEGSGEKLEQLDFVEVGTLKEKGELLLGEADLGFGGEEAGFADAGGTEQEEAQGATGVEVQEGALWVTPGDGEFGEVLLAVDEVVEGASAPEVGMEKELVV